jgi:hypothetical protein
VPRRGFIDRYVEGVIYPVRYTNQVRAACAAIVITSWVVGYLR